MFSTSFEKRLNIYNLNSLLDYRLNYNNFSFGINENYLSSIVKSERNNIKDEQFLTLVGEYNFSPNLQVGLMNQNSIYSDDRKIGINEASTLYSVFYSKFLVSEIINISPYVGLSINKQVKEDDRGIIYGGKIETNNILFDEFLLSSRAVFQNEDIAPRQNNFRLINLKNLNHFDNSFTNVISFNYSSSRKDFYFDLDSLSSKLYDVTKNIQTRIEENIFLEERLFNSKFSNDIFIDFGIRGNLRKIDRTTKFKSPTINISSFDSKIEESKIDLWGNTEYRSDLFYGKLKIELSEREEKYLAKNLENSNPIIFAQRVEQENKKNNSSSRVTISALGSFAISKSDNIGLSLLHRKLVYDTPSKDNFDDRDELLSIFRISYLKNLNKFFDFIINLEGSLNHIVYLFAERSSNNNIRRIIKLSSSGDYKGSRLFSGNTFEVSANYTSYDFEDILINSRSFSFRQFSVKDSTSLQITNKIYADFNGFIKLSEQGNFIWSNFSNNPERFLSEIFVEPKLSVRWNGIKVSLGIRYFSLQTFNYTNEGIKYKFSEYNSVGPMTNFTIVLPSIDLNLYGWYEFIKNESNIRRELANLSLSANWRI